MDDYSTPPLEYLELFADLGNRLDEFETQWNPMVEVLTRCAQKHIEITNSLTEGLTTHFAFPVSDQPNELLRHCWQVITSTSTAIDTDELKVRAWTSLPALSST